MTKSIKLSITLPVSIRNIYEGWLDSKTHSAFTGGAAAKIDARLGEKFSAWDGYIFGTTLELEPDHRIVQSWRTTEFPSDAPDSRLELLFEEVKGGTKITLIHTQLPEDQVEDYRLGWEEHYFQPMQEHFIKKKK